MIGKLPQFSVNRPVFATMVFLIILVLGVFGFARLKIDLLPEIETPTVSISTGYEGASPEVIENQITQIVEEIVGTVPGIEEMTSESSEGRSSVRVRFVWGTNIDQAALELQATLEDEMNELPDDVVRPMVRKWDINNFPVVILGISSRLNPVDLTRLIEEEIRYQFARVPGVSQVDTWGSYYPEVRVEIDPDRLRAFNIPLDQVLTAIRDANLDLPTGEIESGRFEVMLRAPAQYRDLDELRDTVIANRDGSTISIGQIATVENTYEDRDSYDRVNGELGLRIGIRKEANANTVDVSKGILEKIDEVNAAYPQIEIFSILNQGNFIELSIANVARSVLYGGSLAILVLLFFLRNIRSTGIISIAIPISIIATFALMFFGGLTINLMTLGGLALGVGMMVDSSIVVLENIFRRRDETGEDPRTASAEGAREVSGAILASTLTTLVIFLPLVFVQGVTGLLFRDLAYVIVFSLLCSLLVSLSLVPMLCSRMLRPKGEQRKKLPGPLFRMFSRADEALKSTEAGYQRILGWALRHRMQVVLTALLAFIVSFGLRPFIGTELLPPSDESEVRLYGRMETGTQIDIVNEISLELEKIVTDEIPEIRAYYTEVDDGTVDIACSLVPVNERSRSSEEIANALRERVENVAPGMEISVWAPKGQFVLSRILDSGGDGLDVEIRGYELDVLQSLGDEVVRAIDDIPGVADVRNRQREGIPQEEVRIDRAKVADLGLSVRDVARVLRTAIAGSDAGDFMEDGYAYRILVQLQNAEQLSVDEVLNLTLSTPDGDQVALRNLVTTAPSRSPEEINRKEQQRLARVAVNIANRPPGTVAREIQARLDQIPRPEGFTLRVAGSYEKQAESFRELISALLLALMLVYMVLACQYESLRDPLIVMTAAPMAAVGVFITLFLTGTTFNLQSGIGCIMLGGIVVNNAILLVDQAGQLCRAGMGVQEAVLEAGRRRLRPILMTTSTTILGLLPLALGLGEGADAQAPLARAVIGGLLASTLVTLVLAPVVYAWFHGQRAKTVEAVTPVDA